MPDEIRNWIIFKLFGYHPGVISGKNQREHEPKITSKEIQVRDGDYVSIASIQIDGDWYEISVQRKW